MHCPYKLSYIHGEILLTLLVKIISLLPCKIKGSPVLATCDGVFRDLSGALLCCFALPISSSFAFNVELIGAMTFTEISYSMLVEFLARNVGHSILSRLLTFLHDIVCSIFIYY